MEWEVASEEGERESVHINYAQYQVKVALVKLTLTVLSLSISLLCSRTSAAAAAVIAATSKTTNKARFGAGRGNFVDFYDCLLCGIGCCADWLPVGWGQMKMENSNGNGNDEWTTTGVGGERESDGEWKRKVASLRLTPMRLFTQFQIPTQFE